MVSSPDRPAQPVSEPASRRRPARLAAGAAVLAVVAGLLGGYAFSHPERLPGPLGEAVGGLTGANPHPIRLNRPPRAPLSALALIGREMFYDPALSASGTQSCASCHSPQHAYGPPPGSSPVQLGGAHMLLAGYRPPPSLAYLYRQAAFNIGPDAADQDLPTPLTQLAARAKGAPRSAKIAAAAAPVAMVPQGGLFWDGRANTLQLQASGPMTNPVEMANVDQHEVARKLLRASYVKQFVPLFGPGILNNPELLVAEAMSAVARYQIEDPSFHRFDSKYDAWLEGRARLTGAERRGLKLFNDPAKANCGGCHLSKAALDGLPPLFSDQQYEALGVPRNPHIPANRDPNFYDMGLCGPFRDDLAKETQYCGMFLTPTLRNSARRGVYFHNGVYKTLDQVLAFYNRRDVDPGRIYPKDPSGKVMKFNDLPAKHHANIDVTDAPFNRKPGQAPAMTDQDLKDIAAFIRTLDDGYRPGR